MNIVGSLLPNGQDNVILVICFTEHWLRDDISKMAWLNNLYYAAAFSERTILEGDLYSNCYSFYSNKINIAKLCSELHIEVSAAL